MGTQIRVILDIDVHDVAAFLAAANADAHARDSDMVFDETDLTGAACMLLDRGLPPADHGYEIDGSDAELVRSIFNAEEDDL